MLSFHSKTGTQELHAVLTIALLFTAIIIRGCGELNYSLVFHVFSCLADRVVPFQRENFEG